ncbi:MAG: c-type cytochrome [Gemmatimonadaceae bacterium]
MSRISFLALVLPVLALAACTDSSDPGAVVAPASVTIATSRGAVLAQDLCAQCHGQDFNGATFGATACPALGGIKDYTFAQFNKLLVLGVAPDGEAVDTLMTATQALSEEDRLALYQYLRTTVDAR